MADEIEEGWGDILDGLDVSAESEFHVQPQASGIQQMQVSAPDTSQSEGDMLDEQMSEAERRLSKASYYRELLNGSLFNGNDIVASEVEREIRDFVRHRLAVLLGVIEAGPTQPLQDLTQKQIVVLRSLADAVLGNPKLLSNLGVSSSNLVAEKPSIPQRPTLRQRSAPETVAQPVRRPVQPRQEVAPTPKVRIPADGTMVTEGGKIWKIVYRPMSLHEYKPEIIKMLEKLPVGGDALVGGEQILRDGPSSYVRILRSDRTVQTTDKNSKRMPFPSDSSMAALSAMKAGEAINNVSTMNQKILGKLTE